MTTHQEDFHRMALTGWLIGRTQAVSWVECGVLEGETAGYFSRFLVNGYGCDLNADALRVAHERYPHLHLERMDSIVFLKWVAPATPAIFYLDTCWRGQYSSKPEMELIQRRWPGSVMIVNNVDVPGNWLGHFKVPIRELQECGDVLVPAYSMSQPVAGYGVVFPNGAPDLRPHWQRHNSLF